MNPVSKYMSEGMSVADLLTGGVLRSHDLSPDRFASKPHRAKDRIHRAVETQGGSGS